MICVPAESCIQIDRREVMTSYDDDAGMIYDNDADTYQYINTPSLTL